MVVSIGTHRIGSGYPPFIVAELSGNHQGSLERALKLLEEAHKAGAHAVKLQTYTPDTITLKIKGGEFLIQDGNNLWKGRNLYDLYEEAHTPWEWHKEIFDRGRELGVVVFSSPFDETAIDFLEELNAPCYKIASPEIIDLPLIQKAAATGKPLILSTGASTLVEIGEAVCVARENGCKDLILLKCTTEYPTSPVHSHLRTLPHLAESFKVMVGLSDHSLGIGVPLAGIALGACLIEKHLTLSREEGGVDAIFSLEPTEFQSLVMESKRAWQALGEVHYGPLYEERVTLSHRPSLYFVAELAVGQIVQSEHIRSVRPNQGLSPKEIDKVIGLQLKQGVKYGTPVSWNLFKVSHAD
jgi:N-acetylneuraminate synthase